MNAHALSPPQTTEADLLIQGGDVLVDGALEDASLRLGHGVIADLGTDAPARRTLDARGLLVLPGIVDIHGDGFERLIAPRPGVRFDPVIALAEADHQFIANGITTACHALTWSWEGGARGEGPARAVLEALAHLKPTLSVDTRLHLRHETYNLAAEETIIAWLADGRIDCLAFNDHMAGTIRQRRRPDKMRGMIERSGLGDDAFQALVDAVSARADDVPGSIERIAAAGRAAAVPMLSHDDLTPQMRAWHRALGCSIAEFPVTVETAEAAAASGDPIVFGAPNVVRGGSHTGCPAAADMAERGLCTVLASDYYYPSLPLAPFRLAGEGRMELARAWALVSSGPAESLGLSDRGAIAAGLRADIILVEPRGTLPPRIVATIVAGRVVHLADMERLQG